jgi:hypothetical protein
LSGANTSSITAATKRVGLPLEVVTLKDEKVRETYERDLVLVRPDGHVAWRGNELPEKVTEVIDNVRGAA